MTNYITYYQRTPDEVINGFYELSDLNSLSSVAILECSAGNGDIADVFRLRSPQVHIDCVEINPLYCGILSQKGYVVYQGNFLDFVAKKSYNLLLINPPYSTPDDNFAYITHIRKAVTLLTNGAVLLASIPDTRNSTEPVVQLFFRDLYQLQTLGKVETFVEEKIDYKTGAKTKVLFLKITK